MRLCEKLPPTVQSTDRDGLDQLPGCDEHRLGLIMTVHPDAGLNLAKLALIWVALSMAVYRCKQECEPSTFLSMEQHLYRFQWYLRLFAAASVMYGTVLAALGGIKSSQALHAPAAASTHASSSAHAQGEAPQPAGTAKVLSLWPDAMCEAFGLQERMQRVLGGRAASLLRFVIGPAVLMLLCVWWLPQHPMLRRMLLR